MKSQLPTSMLTVWCGGLLCNRGEGCRLVKCALRAIFPSNSPLLVYRIARWEAYM